jgi:hypothetical protein
MRPWLLIPLALPLLAASPARQQLSLAVPNDPSPLIPMSPSPLSLTPKSGPAYEAAPLPNRDLNGPITRGASGPSWTPSLFTTKNQYRGDGFAPGSTAQGEQERNMKPGAGFSLHMPFTPR